MGHPYRTAPRVPLGPLHHLLVEVHLNSNTALTAEDVRERVAQLLLQQTTIWTTNVAVLPREDPPRLDVEQLAEILGLGTSTVQHALDNRDSRDPWAQLAATALQGETEEEDLERARHIIYHLSRFLER